MPYGRDELTELGRHCTEKEDDANKVERLVGKSAAAMLLAPKTGERFDAIVTGASNKGTWVRLLHPRGREADPRIRRAMSATGSAYNWSTRTWSGGTSTSRRAD